MNGCTIDAACLLQRKPAQDNAEAEWYRGFSSELEIKFDGSTAMWWDGTLMCADGRMSRHRRVSKNEQTQKSADGRIDGKVNTIWDGVSDKQTYLF